MKTKPIFLAARKAAPWLLAAGIIVWIALAFFPPHRSALLGSHGDRRIPFDESSKPAQATARAKLDHVNYTAVTTTRDGRTHYEFRGPRRDGKAIYLYVDSDGKVLGFEGQAL